MQVYSNPSREADDNALPDIEVFYHTRGEIVEPLDDTFEGTSEDEMALETGWYWWYCTPGCLPDSDPVGPFGNAEAAKADAQAQAMTQEGGH